MIGDSYTVRQFLATGAITYNGWSAPLIITPGLVGAMFRKIFGYSFVTLRLSTLPLTSAPPFSLTFWLAAQVAAGGGGLRFVDPLPLAPVPAACAVIHDRCARPLLYPDLPLRPYASRPIRRQPAGADLANHWPPGRHPRRHGPANRLACSSLRHSLPHHPSTIRSAVRRRRDLAWLLVVIDMVVCLRWFVRQPNIYIDPPLSKCIRKGLDQPGIAVTNLIMVVFTIVMFSLPAVLPFTLDSLRRLVAAAKFLARSAHRGRGPGSFRSHLRPSRVRNGTLVAQHRHPRGVIGPLELSGNRPAVLPLFVRGIISARC